MAWRNLSDEEYAQLNGLDLSVCAVCGGLGEVVTARGFRPCPAQDCEVGREHRNALVRRMTKLSHIPAQYAAATLDDFDIVAEARRGKTMAYRACRLFAKDVAVAPHNLTDNWTGGEGPFNWLMLEGPVGTGKTFAACAVVNHINRVHGRPARYVRLDDLLREVRDGYERDAEESSTKVIHRYQAFPVLLIDEMNLDRISDHTLEVVESIIRYRYMHDLPTLFTANATRPEFEDMWGERIANVLIDKTLWLRMTGATLRGAPPILGGDDE